ncbi:MAG TPA: 4-hydroxy-tetrahydrodipicolinate synthase [Spirochaetales bacterium]|nr:4-hydroxy-tetrahydrodipicolinate synthase [Spirochaetales bacterium]
MGKFDKEKYGKILIPMVTPFNEDQSVDYEKAVALGKYLIEHKKGDCLILSGTTGEFHTMSFNERVKLFEIMKEKFGKQIPLMAGVGCASTIETVQLAKKAEGLGYELIMIVAPYYAKPNQEELYTHYMKVAESVGVNILLYNIPIFTGVNINPSTLERLAKAPNIVGIKEEAELNPKQVTAYLNATPEDFIVYNGDDTMILEAYAQGGPERIGGVISGASHVIGHLIREMIDTFLAGKIQEAAKMQRKIYPLLKIMGQNNRANPVALWKEAMRLYGIDAGIPRLPLSRGTTEEIEKVKQVMLSLNLIQSGRS